ncbi:hypothetical protein [Moritella sp. F3]|uniref:hypothetical protein n=1 Tax=Moritella sp. F3 TaxID=2718882 RepID=UPI0018E13151|nr:hypothetical protein [Moritella sp. F3]GIC77710.1 hypothetical protein FMO001_24370 [Moritella sp. F1]GIC82123.1 hypothetical protein FMO003_24040 [Moritella sp. F3]
MTKLLPNQQYAIVTIKIAIESEVVYNPAELIESTHGLDSELHDLKEKGYIADYAFTGIEAPEISSTSNNPKNGELFRTDKKNEPVFTEISEHVPVGSHIAVKLGASVEDLAEIMDRYDCFKCSDLNEVILDTSCIDDDSKKQNLERLTGIRHEQIANKFIIFNTDVEFGLQPTTAIKVNVGNDNFERIIDEFPIGFNQANVYDGIVLDITSIISKDKLSQLSILLNAAENLTTFNYVFINTCKFYCE